MQKLTEGKRKKLRELLIESVFKYKNNLLDKNFLIICEDYSFVELSFSKEKFKHLTGIQSIYNNTDFYKNCKNRTFAYSDINENQYYNYNTILKKCKNLFSIDKFLSSDIKDTLFLSNLHTNTRIFPVAIDNTARNICIGFNEQNIASTMRTSTSHLKSDEKKLIIAIFSKGKNEDLYNNLLYIKDTKELVSNCPALKDKLSKEMNERFSYIA